MGDQLDHVPHLEHGAAFIAVDKDQYRPSLFNLPLGKIEVIGTKFIVSADSDGNVCRVSEGEVVLHSPSQQAQVGAGQEARLTPDGHISVLLSPEPPQPRYRWRSPQGEHTLPAANATSLRLNDDNEWTASIPGQEYFVDGISLVLTFAPGPESGQVPLLTLTFRPYMYDFNVPTHLPHRDILIVSIHPDHVPVAQPGAADWENTIHELLEHFHQHRNADLHIPQRQRQLLEVAMFDRVLTSDEQLDLLIQHIHR
ncbi:MAG: hypothetical protein EA401_00125 [Planctomycetota bacterium]|nr:MAG: hypothetical protein EA401_00125 [Planctomycetota bacterium]